MNPLFCNIFKKVTVPNTTPTAGTVAVWGANGALTTGTLTTTNVVTGSGTLTAPNQGKVVVITAANQIGSGYTVADDDTVSSVALRDNAGGIAGTSFYTGGAEENRVVVGSTSSVGFNSSDEITWSIQNTTGAAAFSSMTAVGATDAYVQVSSTGIIQHNASEITVFSVSNAGAVVSQGSFSATNTENNQRVYTYWGWISGFNDSNDETFRIATATGNASFGVSGGSQTLVLPEEVKGYTSSGVLSWQIDNETGEFFNVSGSAGTAVTTTDVSGYDAAGDVLWKLDNTGAPSIFGLTGLGKTEISATGLAGRDTFNALTWQLINSSGAFSSSSNSITLNSKTLTAPAASGTLTTVSALNRAASRSSSFVLGVCLATRTAWANGLSTGATGEKANFDISHVMTKEGALLRATYANSYNADLPGPSIVTVRIAFENYTANPGVFCPAFTVNGSRDLVLNPGAVASFLPVGIAWSVGDIIVERVFVTVPTIADQWPRSVQAGAYTREGGQQSGAEIDLTLSATRPSGSAVFRFGAVALTSLPVVPDTAEVAVIGDSIAYGQGDSPATGAPSTGVGFVQRAFNNVVPYRFLPVSGATASGFTSAYLSRQALAAGCTHALCEFGVNDLVGGATAATLQASWLRMWTALSRMGMLVYQTTVTPVSTSPAPNYWQTEAGQTPGASNANRETCNTWLRAGAPVNSTTKAAVAVGTPGALLAGEAGHPLTGVMDVAATVEGAVSGTWKQDAATRTVTDMGTTASGTQVTSATAAFTSADLGRTIWVGGVYGGIIYQIDSATAVRISPAWGGATASGQTAIIAFALTTDGTHPIWPGHVLMAAAVNTSTLTTLP